MSGFGINELGQLDLFTEDAPRPVDADSWEPDPVLDEWIADGWDPSEVFAADEIDADVDEERWLAGMPADVRAAYLAGPWTGSGESMAAGFLHRDRDEHTGLGFASGGAYDVLAPGAPLASLTEAAVSSGHGQLGESELIGVLCAWRRMSAWAAAGETATVLALAARRDAQSRELRNPHLAEHVADEIGAALTLTSRSSDRLLSVATSLGMLPDVLVALERGQIDWAKACVFADELSVLPADKARMIASKLIDQAADLTTAQLRGRLRRAALAADADAAEQRRRDARTDASVQTWEETSGNSALAGRELDPADVIAAHKRLTAMAKWLQAHGATGTLSQIEAEVYLALLAGRPVEALLPVGPLDEDTAAELSGRSGAGNDGWPAVTGTINLTMPLSAWSGGSAVAEVAGFGPVDAATGRELAAMLASAAGSRWCLTLTDGDGRAAGHACARRGPAGMESGIQWARGLRGKLKILETGACHHARESGSYRPPASLRHLIEIRQRTCTAPGCRRSATDCDLDHVVPFDQGGRTCECNLHPVCRRHHRAKQAPGWHLKQPEPGHMTWRLPSGRAYETVGDVY